MGKRDFEISNQEMSNFYNDIFSKINCKFEIYKVVSYSRQYFTRLIISSFVLAGSISSVPIFYRLNKLHVIYGGILLLIIIGIAVALYFPYKGFKSLCEKSLDRKTYLETLEEIKKDILDKSSGSFDVTIQRLMKELEVATSLNHRRTNFFVGIFLAGFTIIITSIAALGDSYIKDTLAGVFIALSIAILLITATIYGIQKDIPFLGKQYKYSKIRNIYIVYYYGYDSQPTLNRYK